MDAHSLATWRRSAYLIRDRLAEREARPRLLASGLGVMVDAWGAVLHGPLLPDGQFFTEIDTVAWNGLTDATITAVRQELA